MQDTTLIEITKVTDTETDMYSIGDIDFNIRIDELDSYLKTYQDEGRQRIIETLDKLKKYVYDRRKYLFECV